MVATTLSIGDVGLIGYNGGSSDGSGRPATTDKFHFVLLTAIGSGTQINFTDRTWNGTAFANSGTDGTFTYTASTDLAAGTVITITATQLAAAGIDFEHVSGEAIYVYQGAVNAPTQFLFALEGGDGNTTFGSSLANTGLTVGNGAISVPYDSGAYSGPTTFSGSLLHNGGATLFQSLSQSDNWYGDDQDGLNAVEAQVQTGPWLVAPNVDVWGTAAGGGGAIVHTTSDPTVASGLADYNHAELYNGLLSGGVSVFWNLRDMVFDTVEGKFFVVDSDIGGGHNRILQGNISDLLGNPGTIPTLTTLYSDTGTTTASRMDNFEVDTVNNLIYFTHGSNVERIGYNTANQTSTVLFRANVTAATSPSGVINPAGSTNNFFNDMVINFTTGSIYLSSTRVGASSGGDIVQKNFIYELTGLTTASGTDAFQFNAANTGTARLLPFAQNDDAYNPVAGTTSSPATAANQAYFFAQEFGTLDGLAINPVTNTLYFSTGAILFDHDGDGDTADVIYEAGIIGSYALGANAANGQGNMTVLHTQPGGQNTGLYGDLEIDVAGGRLYVTDYNGTGAANEDSHLYSISLAGGTRTQYSDQIGNIEGLSTVGFTINHAPTVLATGVSAGSTTVTEVAGANSGETSGVALYSAITVDDIDTGPGNEIAGAVIRISANFQSGAGHQDFLRINGNLTGTVAGTSITYAYNQATGAMILTGQGTVAQYQSAIALVTFSMNGDNPTNYGTALTRSFAVAVTDGLTVSDEVNASVTVTGVNDAPINSVGGTLTLNEDAGATALTGISIADADARGTDVFTIVFNVGAAGTLNIATGVANGITAGQITAGANGTNTITVTASLNAINTTLANASGLTFTPTPNFNGNSGFLSVLTSDGGATGTGGTQIDTDAKTISVTAVNDAPVATGSATSAVILEDAAPAGQTVSALFGSNYSDATDQVSGGSSADAFAGIAITSNAASANGVWQYFGGGVWQNITTGVTAATAATLSAGTLIRFLPTANYNGAAPTLTATLVDASGGALTDNASVNASFTGGTTRFSTGSVVLSQAVTAVNDAPTLNGLQGDSVTTTETAGTGSTVPTVKIDVGGNATVSEVALDNTNFNGGSIRFAITAGLSATQDQLNIDTAAATTVTVAGGTVSVGGTAIGTVTGGGAGGADLVVALNASATPTLVQTLIRAIDFANTGGDNPTAGARTITTTLIDGGGTANGGVDTRTVTSTVTVAGVNDPAVASPDSNNVLENATITGASVFGNDNDPDGPALSVSAVNGIAGNVGSQITLASGATVTLRADGTYDYNPNGRFNTLIDAATATATGAGSSSATDSFSYTLTGGNTVSVTITVNGVQSSDDRLLGTTGDNTITGTPQNDYFDVSQGGNDTANGGAGNDAFYFGAAFTAADSVDGDPGGNDQIGLQGNYAAGLTLGANSLVNIETLAVLPGFSYNLTSIDANVAAGQLLQVFGGNLGVGENFTFNGSAETDGSFRMFGGLGTDTFTGGALDDGFYFGPGKFGGSDVVTGGGGTNDQLALDGNYTATIGSNANVEVLALLGGPVGNQNSFNITLADTFTPLTQTRTVFATTVTTSLVVDGSAESNGILRIFGGQAADTITGGAGNDFIFGNTGGDTLRGGAGADTFYYDAVNQSSSVNYDRLIDFDYASDRIQIAGQTHDTYSAVTSGTLSTASFDTDLATALNAQLTGGNAVFFTPTAGTLAGTAFLVVDANGIDGYQAGQDYVFQVTNPPPALPPTDFIIP